MKNTFLKISIILILTLSCIMGFVITSYAEEKTVDVFNISEKQHMMVNVLYTNGVPSVKFIAPNGSEYADNAISEGKMRKENDGSAVVFYIPNAMPGQWKMVYDQGANTELEITWAPYGEEISITEFSYEKDGSDNLSVTFNATYIDDSRYDYTITAVSVNESGVVTSGRVIKTGSAYANSKDNQKVNVNLQTLSSNENYYLKLAVSVDLGGVTAVNECVSENSFSYTNQNLPQAIEDVYLETCFDDEYIKIDWSKFRVYCDNYIMELYLDDSVEPVYQNVNIANDATYDEILIENTAAKYTIKLAYVRNGVVSEYLTKEIDMAMAKALTINSNEITAASRVEIKYDFKDFGGVVPVSVTVNETSEEKSFSGTDSFYSVIDEFENDVFVTWKVSDTLVFKAHKQVYSDRIAPDLSLPEITSVIKTDKEKYVLVGNAETGSIVTVDGQKIDVNENGGFTVELSLNNGENEFVVRASDEVGNSAVQTVIVERINMMVIDSTENTSGFAKLFFEYVPLIAAFFSTVLITAQVIICINIYKKKDKGIGKKSAIMTIVGSSLICADVILGVATGYIAYKFIKVYDIVSSMKFVDELNKSISDAYELVQSYELLKTLLISFVSVFVIFAVLGVLLLVFVSKERKKRKLGLPTFDDENCRTVVEKNKECEGVSDSLENQSEFYEKE